MLDKVLTTYQTQATNNETQAVDAVVLIGKLNKEKEVMAERVEMDIRRVRIIIGAQRERLNRRMLLYPLDIPLKPICSHPIEGCYLQLFRYSRKLSRRFACVRALLE